MVADLLVGAVWIAVAAALMSPRRTRRSALLAAAFGAAWLLGSVDPSLALVHRGPLAHLLLAYPTGRLASTPVRVAVAAAYLSGFTPGAGWTLAFAIGLAGAAAVRFLSATGVVRRSRLVPLLASVCIGGVLATGAVASLAGGRLDVLVVYQAVLVLAGVAVAADLRAARWSSGSITGLVVDLGRQPIGGAVRERLARAIGDPTLTVAYVIGGETVDELGRAVELPADERVVTPVTPGGEAVALLIHDPAVLADRALLDGAAAVLGIAVVDARLQAQVRARVGEVVASTRRLLDAAEAERRRLADDLRARIDPLLAEAAGELRASDARGELLARVGDVRDGLFQLAAGLDPLQARGLGPALVELAGRAGLPASVSVSAERFPPALESCVWFTCSEALANTLKHAHASRLEISVERAGPTLRVEVADDGVGGADAGRGTGLRRLAERVAAAGGRLAVDSTPGTGTRVVAELDLGAVA